MVDDVARAGEAAPHPASRLRRFAPSAWSLRLRVVVGVVCLTAMALAVIGTLGVTLLRSYLIDQVDQQLSAVADGLRAPGPGASPGPGARDLRRAGERPRQDLPTPFIFTIVSTTGSVISQVGGSVNDGGPRPDLTTLDLAKARAGSLGPVTVPAVGGGSGFRVRAVADADGSTTVVALSLSSSDATVRRLETITIVASAVVLVLLIGLASVLVGIGLRPLRAVESTAERISGGDLSRRVPTTAANTEVGRLVATLNTMLEQIEAAFADRAHSEATLRQFIADASHELRTPLTTVRGYAELVNRGALTDDQQHRHAIQRIEAEAARMGALVDDLLLLAYLDQQRPLQTARVDLGSVVSDAVADARARGPEQRIDYVGPVRQVPVEVDVDRMRQVLGNLLGNAVVHTPPETSIRVRLGYAENSAGGDSANRDAVITVADDGPGVGPEQASRLFERFYRADPGRSRSRGGTGLGLSIAAAVVAASGGTITCASTAGEGTTFTITLPLAQPQPLR